MHCPWDCGRARARILAERGASGRPLMAVFPLGEPSREAMKYTAAADRKRLADAETRLLEDQNENSDCLTRTISPEKSLEMQLLPNAVVGGDGLEPPALSV